jgi:sugar PTS system EIIA component
MSKILRSPMSGTLLPLEEVPDEVFSKKMLGDGVAILPEEGIAESPIEGKIGAFLDTGHACGIITEEGVEILIHIGIDTVEMNGIGFFPSVKKEQSVVTGQKLIDFNIKAIEDAGKSLISPVIVIGKPVRLIAQGKIKRGEPLMIIED